ncbi:MAG: BspA family leucine-rich repeat surface protein [Cytophagales bacterium]|nr:BspA family leucine-rich repeat surface protein [Cytophagales bacterium]
MLTSRTKYCYIVLLSVLGYACEKNSSCPNVTPGAMVDNNGCPVFIYLDETNHTTIIAAPEAIVGESYTLNGQEYLVADSTILYDRIAAGEDVSHLVTTRVTNMRGLLQYLPDYPESEFNEEISHWDVSNVTNMSYLFDQAGLFNQDLSAWDVSSVTSMQEMFSFAGGFNQDISDWDVSSVTHMERMFKSALSFDHDLTGWEVNQVTHCAYFGESTGRLRGKKPLFTNCADGKLEGVYPYKTTNIWCANDREISGDVAFLIHETGHYTFSDWTFGAYTTCWGRRGSSTISGDVSFIVVDGVLTFTEFEDNSGTIWSFKKHIIKGDTWRFEWHNNYEESASVAITFEDGVPFNEVISR